MSLAELIEVLDRTSDEERLFAQAYLKHLQRAEDPAYREEIARRIDRRKYFSLEQVTETHQFLADRGL